MSAADAVAAEDEAYWAEVRRNYKLQRDVINLDHGWTNPTTVAAMDEVTAQMEKLEALPAEQLITMWETVTSTTVRAAVADVMRVPATEIALVRNATEAINTVLLGLPLKPGDEIVCSAHDYYAMLDALEQRQARDGVIVRTVRPPIPAPSMSAIAELYEAALTPRTRLVLLTHPSNVTGQLLPVARIAAAAHRAGAEVLVDGAQSLGLLEDPVKALGCDYYGASLHKWLGAPVGLGVLWMRPEHASKVWPAVPPSAGAEGMARFEAIGTTPEFISPGVLPALALHRSIGETRKAARLRYLNEYWRSRAAAALPDARFYTLSDPEMSCGLCVIELPGKDSAALQRRLRDVDHILVQAMDGGARRPEIKGLRVSPNVYTTPAELDRFIAALTAAAKS